MPRTIATGKNKTVFQIRNEENTRGRKGLLWVIYVRSVRLFVNGLYFVYLISVAIDFIIYTPLPVFLTLFGNFRKKKNKHINNRNKNKTPKKTVKKQAKVIQYLKCCPIMDIIAAETMNRVKGVFWIKLGSAEINWIGSKA